MNYKIIIKNEILYNNKLNNIVIKMNINNKIESLNIILKNGY